MTPWRKVDKYAVTNGPQSISKKNDDGCSMYCLHEGDRYTKYSEDECEVVVAATYPDAESMKSYLETGGLSGVKLREQCLALWKARKEAESVFKCIACYPKLCHCRGEADLARADERAAA